MSFSMFCAIPMPFHLWDSKCLNLVLPCFPLIGAFIGVLWWGIFKILTFSGIHTLLVAVVTMLTPFIASGFLHLDGYMDTSDAVLSRRPLEDRLRILKDPHPGSFAVIMLAVLFIVQFAAVYVIVEKRNYPELFIVIPVVSRCCAAMSILCLKPMEQSGLASMFRENTGTRHKIFVVFIFAVAAALSYFFAGIYGFIVVLTVMAVYAGAMAHVYKNLKGVSGDLAGYALVISELAGLVVMAII